MNAAQTERLKANAEDLGVDAEELARGAAADLVSANADDFESAAARARGNNRGFYSRLVYEVSHLGERCAA